MNAVTMNMKRIEALEKRINDMPIQVGSDVNPNKDVVKSIVDLRTQIQEVKTTQVELQLLMDTILNRIATIKNDNTVLFDNICKELTNIQNVVNKHLTDDHNLDVVTNTTQPAEPLKQYVVDAHKPPVPPDAIAG